MTTIPNPNQPPTITSTPFTTSAVNEVLRFEPNLRLGRQAEAREEKQIMGYRYRDELIERLAMIEHEGATDGESAGPCEYCRTKATSLYLPLIVEFVADWLKGMEDERAISDCQTGALIDRWREEMQP